jgi:3-hydroxybutyryl-CoA dehydratase
MGEKDMSILDKLGVSMGLQTVHEKTVTEADIRLFAEVSGDFNPLHLREEFAQRTFFGGRIAHGALSTALLSAAMAKLPGVVVFLSQSVKFLKPIRIGDRITAVAEVIGLRKDKGIVTLKNTCLNQKGETVVEGEAAVRLYEKPA